jgi:hypothetical protein
MDMTEELGKIEKPPVTNFKNGRKLFFVPLIYGGKDLPEDYLVKFQKYWEQVGKQVEELTAKLGEVNRIYHELIAASGEEAMKTIEGLNEKSHKVVRACLDKKAQLEAVEDNDILTEFMDWGRCLVIGLLNPKVVAKIYDFYVEVGKKRNEYITRKIDETLQENEIGLLLMRENHQVQFPPDIQIFYVAPPALDEIKRWLRENEGKAEKES